MTGERSCKVLPGESLNYSSSKFSLPLLNSVWKLSVGGNLLHNSMPELRKQISFCLVKFECDYCVGGSLDLSVIVLQHLFQACTVNKVLLRKGVSKRRTHLVVRQRGFFI